MRWWTVGIPYKKLYHPLSVVRDCLSHIGSCLSYLETVFSIRKPCRGDKVVTFCGSPDSVSRYQSLGPKLGVSSLTQQLAAVRLKVVTLVQCSAQNVYIFLRHNKTKPFIEIFRILRHLVIPGNVCWDHITRRQCSAGFTAQCFRPSFNRASVSRRSQFWALLATP